MTNTKFAMSCAGLAAVLVAAVAAAPLQVSTGHCDANVQAPPFVDDCSYHLANCQCNSSYLTSTPSGCGGSCKPNPPCHGYSWNTAVAGWCKVVVDEEESCRQTGTTPYAIECFHCEQISCGTTPATYKCGWVLSTPPESKTLYVPECSQ